MAPKAVRRFRAWTTVPVKLERAATSRFLNETKAWGVIQSNEIVSEVLEQRRADARRPEIQQPPWEVPNVEWGGIADWRRSPWREIERWLPGVRWGVAGMLGAWFALRMAAGRWWLRRGSSVPGWSAEQVIVVMQTARDMGLVRNPAIRISPRVASPLLAGFWRPTVYLPPVALDWATERLRMVFLHELAHWRRRDPVWLLIGRLAACVFWWNPLAAFAVRRMCREAEEAADDEVVLRKVGAPDYAETLVAIAATPSDGSLAAGAVEMAGVAMVFRRSALEKRIRALLAASHWRGRMGWFAACAVLVLGVMSAGAVCLLVRKEASAQTAQRTGRKLTAEERVLLERIRDNTRRRLHAFRYVHVKLEKILGEEREAERAVTPQPTRLEAWADLWTGRYRAQMRPNVFVFARRPGENRTPLNVEDKDEINDGRRSYAIRLSEVQDIEGNSRSVFDGELQYMLGYQHLTWLWEHVDDMLKRGVVSDDPEKQDISKVGVFMASREGKPVVRVVDFSMNSYPRAHWIFEVDPSLDDLLVYQEEKYIGSLSGAGSRWMLYEAGRTESGEVYARRHRRELRTKEVFQFSDVTVTAFDVLKGLPEGVFSLPEQDAHKYLAKDGVQIHREQVILHCVDADTWKPVPGVSASVKINWEDKGRVQADGEGRLVIALPKEEIVSLDVRIAADGFSQHWVNWNKQRAPIQVPDNYTVRLRPAVGMSGRVIDESGRPIANAKVELRPGRYGALEIFNDRLEGKLTTKTDAQGRWKIEGIARNLTGFFLDILVTCPGYVSASGDFRRETGFAYESLWDGSCEIQLARERIITGAIVDSDGKPVAKCKVSLGGSKFFSGRIVTRSDANGMFTLRGVAEGKARITFEDTIHKPRTMLIEAPLAEPMRVALEPGRVVRGRVVGLDGKPRVGASVWVSSWKAGKADERSVDVLEFRTETDVEGCFVWRGAPDEPVTIGFGNCGDGVRSLYDYPLVAREEEYVIINKPALRVLGTVVDANTGKPVPLVRVTPGACWNGEDSSNSWEQQETMTYRDGNINWQNERMGMRYQLRVEAEGYEPLTSRVYPSNQDEFTEVFRLKKKT
nr:M56 family metallopeptidase [Geminisphaera colitermitum]